MRARWNRRLWVVTGSVVAVAAALNGPANAASGGAAAAAKKFTATSVGAPTSTFSTPKSASGRLAQSDPSLLRSTDSKPVNVMVKLDLDGAAAYAGGLAEFKATSPQTTGRDLNASDPDVAKYLKHASAETSAAGRAIQAKVPAAKIGQSYTVAYGGLALRLPADQAKSLLSVPGVVAVQRDTLNHPLAESATTASAAKGSGGIDNDASTFVGADKVWPSLGGSTKAGQGVIVADLDTGIWPEHPMLKDLGIPRPRPASKTFGCQFGNGTNAKLGPKFTCNDKLVGAYAFLKTALTVGGLEDGEYCDEAAQVCSARDADGHGTHTSTTAAGSPVQHSPLLGVDRGPISGMAPGASVIEYRVCTASGCYGSDSVAAVQQAILDGVDVINFSISGGASAYTDPVELAFLDAYKAGITVSASAGNSGPGVGTAEHAGPWVLTVGALTSDRAFSSTLKLTSTDGTSYSTTGSTITQGVTDAPVVLAGSVPGYKGTKNCLEPFAADSVTGKVVVCQRGSGGGGRVEKGYFAKQGGAAGMILYNPTNMGDTETDNHFLPAIHVEGPATDMLAFFAKPGVHATWAQGEKTRAQGDVMAGFSSRGPVGDFLKPDIAAPGVQVLAGHTPTSVDLATGPQGQLFQAIAGTSMSAPHSTGIAALVKAAHPSWTPGQIKSALMTSSVQDVVNADGSAATPRDTGAGSIRADRAVDPSLTFDVTPAEYAASAADPMGRVDLNLPSIKANPLPGALETYRYAKNVSGNTQSYKVSVAADAGLRIKVTPSTFTLRPGATKKLSVVLDATKADVGDTDYGQITIKPEGHTSVPVVMPVEAVVGQGGVTLSHTCDPTTVKTQQATHCSVTATNFTPVEAPATVQVDPDGMSLSNITAPATGNARGASWSGTLAAAEAPTVDSITPGVSPGEGYLPLSLFGIAPESGIGDETVSNYNVAPFTWGGETYDSIGVDSNGYVIVGGGASEDNTYPDGTTTIPNTARPNNIIAPFWTDLDPSTGGEVRIGSLDDGTNKFLVIDYSEVVPYGSTIKNSFQVWIQLGDTESQWISYGDVGGPNGQPLLAGAENRDGTSGVSLDTSALTGEYAIKTSPPKAGGSVTFTYDATSGRAGRYNLLASLTTPVVRGTTKQVVPITVTKK